MTWEFHVDESNKGRYDIILGRYFITDLGLDLKLPKKLIAGSERPY